MQQHPNPIDLENEWAEAFQRAIQATGANPRQLVQAAVKRYLTELGFTEPT